MRSQVGADVWLWAPACGGVAASLLHRADRKAVVIMGSQKTLGIAAAVLEFMPPEAGSQGLIIVPVLVSHLSQILMDAPLAVRWSTVKDKPVTIVKRSGKRRVLRLDSHGSFRQPSDSGSDDGSSSAMPLAAVEVELAPTSSE